IRPTPGSVERMNDVVRGMHTTSGLLEELDAGLEMAEAQRRVLDYVRQWAPEPRKAPLAGNSVGTDRTFLARDMPELVDHLHYRIIDVSSIKELARRWYPRAYFHSPEKAGGTAPWRTSSSPSTSCATTGPCSSPTVRGPTPRPPRPP